MKMQPIAVVMEELLSYGLGEPLNAEQLQRLLRGTRLLSNDEFELVDNFMNALTRKENHERESWEDDC
jgi:hypothetical protein